MGQHWNNIGSSSHVCWRDALPPGTGCILYLAVGSREVESGWPWCRPSRLLSLGGMSAGISAWRRVASWSLCGAHQHAQLSLVTVWGAPACSAQRDHWVGPTSMLCSVCHCSPSINMITKGDLSLLSSWWTTFVFSCYPLVSSNQPITSAMPCFQLYAPLCPQCKSLNLYQPNKCVFRFKYIQLTY